MIRKFKIIYILNGRTKVKEVEATSKYNAKRLFYDIIRIEEVKE